MKMSKSEMIRYIKMRLDILNHIDWDNDSDIAEAMTCADGIISYAIKLLEGNYEA